MNTTNDGYSVTNVAIFGLGRAGKIHIGNLISNPRVYLKYVIDPDKEVLKSICQQYHLKDAKAISFEEADVVFADSDVRAVIISSTTYTHEDLIVKSLNAGKAVFCEKPIANDLEGVISCYRLAREKNGILHCSFNRRFDPSFMDARARLREEVGDIHSIKTTSRDSPLPPLEYIRISSGMFHDCAVHDIDLICWTLGEWPTTVFAMGTAQDPRIKEMDDVDVVSILLRFPSGIIGHIDISRHSAVGYDQRMEVAGMKGMLKVVNSSKNKVKSFNSSGCHANVFDYSFPQRYRESYQMSLTHFLNVIDGTEKPGVDALSSINVTKLATLCEESYRQGVPKTFEATTSL